MIAFTPEQLVPWIYFNLGVKYVGVYHHQHGDVVTKWPTEYPVERLAFEDSSGDIYTMAFWALEISVRGEPIRLEFVFEDYTLTPKRGADDKFTFTVHKDGVKVGTFDNAVDAMCVHPEYDKHKPYLKAVYHESL